MEGAQSIATQEKASATAVQETSCPHALHMSRNLPNFRDLSTACFAIRPGRIFRCANPVEATEQDVQALLGAGVTTLVDLRSCDEVAEDGESRLFSNIHFARYSRGWTYGMVKTDQPTPSAPDECSQSVTRHNISLLERSRYYIALLLKLPFKLVVSALLMQLLNRQKARQMLIGEVNAGGLHLMYKIMVDSAKPEFCKVFNVMTEAACSGQSIMFFCKVGKDRTGLVAAMVLAVCGATDEEIMADYVKSDGYHKVALAGLEKKEELQGLDMSVFERAPESAITGLLDYVKQYYGSLTGYLNNAGFTYDKQARLREALTTAR